MPQTVQCPQCKSSVAVRDEAAGKRVKCPNCGKEFLAPGFAASSNDDDDWLLLDHETPAGQEPPPTAESPTAESPAATPLAGGAPQPPAGSSQSPAPAITPAPAVTPAPGSSGPPLSAADQKALGQFDAEEFTSHAEPLPSKGPAGSPPSDDVFGDLPPVAVGGGDDLFDELPPVASGPPPAVAQAEDIEYESEYRVKCNICGSILYAKATQQGKEIKCSDCYSTIIVPPPPRKKKKPQLSVDNAQTFQLEESAPRERADPYRKSAEELLEQAEKTEEDEPEPSFDAPDVRDWVLKIVGVFFDPGVLAHWIFLSMLAGFPAYMALWLEHKVLVLALFPGAILFSALVVACGFAILISVANDRKTVSDWPTMDPIGWFENLFVVFAAAALAAFPAWALGHIFFQPGLLAIGLTMASVYTLFPFFLLSMLDMESVMVPFSPEVARSISRCQEAWGGFYFSAGLMFFGLFLFYFAISSAPPAGAAVIGIFVTVGVAFMYFAMIGRLAYAIGQSVNDPPREMEVDRSRPPQN